MPVMFNIMWTRARGLLLRNSSSLSNVEAFVRVLLWRIGLGKLSRSGDSLVVTIRASPLKICLKRLTLNRWLT